MRTEALVAAAEILLLADQEYEVHLVKGAAETSRISVVSACPEVLEFLRRHERHRNSPRPDLILLDLDLSDSEHCDTLRDIKKDPDLRRIPIVVMASSDSHAVIQDAYNLHANAYIVKPKDHDEFIRVIKATLTFWLTLARLPRG